MLSVCQLKTNGTNIDNIETKKYEDENRSN